MLFGRTLQPAFSFRHDNWGAVPSTHLGTLLTAAGTANTEGSWTAIASSSDIAQDVYWVSVRFTAFYSSGASRQVFVDLGIDPAGGTSYVERVPNLIAGNAADTSTPGGGQHYLFPCYIKAGSSVAMRVQADAASATGYAAVVFWGQPSHPESVLHSSYCETLGTVTNTTGVSVTAGSAADGSWTSIGTSTKPHSWWQIGYQINNATQNAHGLYVELGYGATKVSIMRRALCNRTSESLGDLRAGNALFLDAYCPLPASTEMFVRIRSDGTADTGHNVLVYGFGG